MLIVRQKFRLHMLGHYIRLCHIIMCNMHKTWGLIYLHTMRTLPTSCHVVLHVQWCHACIVRHTHAGKLATLIICGMPGITHGCAFTQAEQYISKLRASHFGILKMKFANQNVLERILVAMHNENKANCNGNFRICAENP